MAEFDMPAELNLRWKAELPIVTTFVCTFVCSFVLTKVLIPLFWILKPSRKPGATYDRAFEEQFTISFGQEGRPSWNLR